MKKTMEMSSPLQSFFMVNPQGKVAGCHLFEPVASIFELPKLWNGEKFKKLKEKYEKCTKCSYLCYIFCSFYSIYEATWSLYSLSKETLNC